MLPLLLRRAKVKGKMNNNGFTLLEILCVLVIVAIISALAYAKYSDFEKMSETSTNRYEQKSEERKNVYDQYFANDEEYQKIKEEEENND